jgi:type VI secretion system protein VasG
MNGISRVNLFGKLDGLCYQAIESATTFAKLRGNRYVELAHWLHQILHHPDSDLHRILPRFEVDAGVLARDVVTALDRLPRGATAVSDFSPHIEEAIERGWIIATLQFNATTVRSGHLLLACFALPTLRNTLLAISREFGRILPEVLGAEFADITSRSSEMAGTQSTQAAAENGAITPAALGRREALSRYATDLTERAREGKVDPVVGRDEEIRQVVDILLRRRQNNPILTGEAGVGKTAIVEGFALRIARGEVPPPLRNVSVYALDIGLLQAGASAKGEFEQRLNAVVEEVQASEKPIVLFIDEAHTLIGAGGSAGTGDAANLLKPALARGTLRTIAATTWGEYKKHIEKDPALTRRFQVVAVDEPDEARAIAMMRTMVATLEQHHSVEISGEAVAAAVTLSHRYIPARQLPDKSLGVLDTACARVAVSQHAVPAAVEDCRQRIATLNTTLCILEREAQVGTDNAAQVAEVHAQLDAERAELCKLETRWRDEATLVAKEQQIRATLRGNAAEASDAQRALMMEELRRVQAERAALQGEQPLVLTTVDRNAVASVVQDWTGIPVGRMVRDEVGTILSLADALSRRVVGQDHAMQIIARRVQTSRAGLGNPGKPVGVFLLCGPSGVGKTETALALAEILHGGEQNLTTINMSEFQEAHTVSTLKGAPPGYVGYGEGGVLTEAVRRRPHSVVLLDEIEKAHPDVHELFFQVFDKGEMEDGEGRRINFRNTLILLTSNVGSERLMHICRDPARMPEPEVLTAALRDPLLEVFPPALLGRLVVVPYYPLSDAMIGQIIRLQLDRIGARLQQAHGVEFVYDDAAVELIAGRCRELESGGRMIDAILTNTLLPSISHHFLQDVLVGRSARQVHVSAADGEFSYSFASDDEASAPQPSFAT